MNGPYDVFVAGGGVAGALCAIAAGRCGARVLVAEATGALGGALVNCGVGPMMTFHAGEKQVIRGLMEELVERLVRGGFSPGHVRDTTGYVRTVTPFSREGLQLTLDEMAAEAGCQVLFHTMVGAARAEGDRIVSLTLCNQAGLREERAAVYLDATGDAQLSFLAGAPTRKGRESDGASQPMTMNMRYGGVDTAALRAHLLGRLEEFPRLRDHRDLVESVPFLSVAGFEREWRAAKERGEVHIPREDVLFFAAEAPDVFIVNTTRILGRDGTDPGDLSAAQAEGRRQCRELDRFLRAHVPGFAQARLELCGPSIGIRGSRQLRGLYTLTAEDILSCRRFPHVIAHAAYPIDVHSPDGAGTATTHLPPDGYYSIPYEALCCARFSNLLVCGRCVSATFEAQAAIRTTPTVGSMAHACGAAAALAARTGADVRRLPVEELQRTLLKQGAYLELN